MNTNIIYNDTDIRFVDYVNNYVTFLVTRYESK